MMYHLHCRKEINWRPLQPAPAQMLTPACTPCRFLDPAGASSTNRPQRWLSHPSGTVKQILLCNTSHYWKRHLPHQELSSVRHKWGWHFTSGMSKTREGPKLPSPKLFTPFFLLSLTKMAKPALGWQQTPPYVFRAERQKLSSWLSCSSSQQAQLASLLWTTYQALPSF